jgi:hypothetical protein
MSIIRKNDRQRKLARRKRRAQSLIQRAAATSKNKKKFSSSAAWHCASRSNINLDTVPYIIKTYCNKDRSLFKHRRTRLAPDTRAKHAAVQKRQSPKQETSTLATKQAQTNSIRFENNKIISTVE